MLFTSSGLINNSETKQIQLVLKDSQKSEFEDLENEQVTLTVEEYYEGLQNTIRAIVREEIEVLDKGSNEFVFPFEVYPKVLEHNARIAQSLSCVNFAKMKMKICSAKLMSSTIATQLVEVGFLSSLTKKERL